MITTLSRRMTIREASRSGLLTVGRKIKTSGAEFHDTSAEGIIGEVNDHSFYFHQNSLNGSQGQISPHTTGYRYSWVIELDDDENGWIEIIDAPSSTIVQSPGILECHYILVDSKGTIQAVLKDKSQVEEQLALKPDLEILQIKHLKKSFKIEEI